jgi:ribosome-binding protein aMBF1 (putative translation factor)
MPNIGIGVHCQQWEPVIIRRSRKKKPGAPKFTGRRDADQNTTTFKTQSTTVEYRRALMDARIAKRWKQTELAQKLNVTAKDIQSWESGKTVPPGNIRGKLNRILQTKLPQIQRVRNRDDA